jgi:hypothetical protein
MALVMGIDPGAGGAIAMYDTMQRRCVRVIDMPHWYVTVGKSKKKRKRLDAIAIASEFDLAVLMGVELCVMERVNGLPGQSASAAFAFGVGVGQLVQALVDASIILETVPPLHWKRIMKVPGKNVKDYNQEIVGIAQQYMPADAEKFIGARGGLCVDRAEAAMIAMYGGDHVLPSLGDSFTSDEHYTLYQNVNI